MIALFGQEFIPIVALGGQVKGARPPAVCGRVGTLCGLGNQARCFRAVKVAAPAVATKVAAMSTSDLKPVLASSERFGE